MLDGKSYDTSRGFSPLDGLEMGTRCGAIDASAITFIGAKEGMSYAELDEMMNKRSGVQGMTDLSSDMRDIDKAYNEGNPRAIVARDMYYNRVKKFVGAYAAEMGGVDLIVFTGGVGREFRANCAGRSAQSSNSWAWSSIPAANEVRGRGQNPLDARVAGQSRSHRYRRGADDRHRHLQSGQMIPMIPHR